MADILIRGMEMPHGKDHITITINADGTVQKLMDVYCKVVAEATELPEHGDLIDRDALNSFIESGECNSVGKALQQIDKAPVVIQSNKEDAE